MHIPSLKTSSSSHSSHFVIQIVQVKVMEKLEVAIPDGKFWIKLNATDIKAALQKSTKEKWNGDSDLQDGRLEALRVKLSQKRHGISPMFKSTLNLV